MSTPTFLAWSLVAAGALAFIFFVTERYVRKPEARLTGQAKQAFIALILVFYGAVVTHEIADLIFAASPPAWTKLLSSAVPLMFGLFFLIAARDKESRSDTRWFGIMLIALGIVTLTLDGYRYAISLGTAASWGVR